MVGEEAERLVVDGKHCASASPVCMASLHGPPHVPVTRVLSISDEQTSSSSNGSRTPSPQQCTGSASGGGVCGSPTPPETYSRKVFVGGLPPDIDQGTSQRAL